MRGTDQASYSQRRYFYYLTGCNLADCHFAYDIASSKSILFIPPIDPDDVIWSGLPVSIDDALALYDVDEVRFTNEINPTLAHLAAQSPKLTVFALAGQVSDNITFLEFANKDFAALKDAIELSRVVKDEFEVAMMRKANHISSLAHKAVVQRARTAEYECASWRLPFWTSALPTAQRRWPTTRFLLAERPRRRCTTWTTTRRSRASRMS